MMGRVGAMNTLEHLCIKPTKARMGIECTLVGFQSANALAKERDFFGIVNLSRRDKDPGRFDPDRRVIGKDLRQQKSPDQGTKWRKQ
ncbi:hypothetical protein TBK1r_19060 [Stieleria magnilauensis]|uniref:Uncharacterized protein n=1 Tax=Stieleria magnilauensis TaxID=2527963 RepID=A0ABX5XLW3_9BACT|nr:hypothetical protein TBK1r_19060 [Planctomycetes bacterium TBK1r]